MHRAETLDHLVRHALRQNEPTPNEEHGNKHPQVAITIAARSFLPDRLSCDKPSRPVAATKTAPCLDALSYP